MATANNPLPPVTNVIIGKILHKESGNGIANLLVDVFDLDTWADPEMGAVVGVARAASSTSDGSPPDLSALYKACDRIGSAYTNDKGEFRFDVIAKDFNTAPKQVEQKPDLILLVLAPEEPGLDITKRLLHFSTEIRFNAGSNEAYIVRLSSALLNEKQIPFTMQEDTSDSVQGKINAYIAQRQNEVEYTTGVATYHGTQATQATQERKDFRTDFLKQIGTDFSKVQISGILVADGDSIKDKNIESVNVGVVKANDALGGASAQGVPVNLYLTPEDRTRLQSYFNAASDGVTEIPESDIGDILFRTNSSANPGTLLTHNNPIANFCAQETADVKCAKVHTGLANDDATTPVLPTTPETSDAISDADIPTFIGRLLKDMPTPDSVLRPNLTNKRADQNDVQASVNNFSLQKGPAEVPAFYDMDVLQIAFDHVWKQLFDENIPNLAYTANTLGQSRFGINNLVTSLLNNGLTFTNTFFNIAPVAVPPVVARFFDINTEEYNDMSFAIRDQLVNIASRINIYPSSTVQHLRVIQSLTEQGERLIDSVRHDDYYTLHKTLRDLNDRLNGKYDFTIFAADKDYHSVNFGLVSTYRQQWTPLAYQAGKLMKTIPLAPKEEKKYSMKLTRTQKRSLKEAKKNNSSLTNEQSSTSRVEADIMEKAQNKATFGATAEGSYTMGVSSGKGTTTFGVEALNESSQNRKDFRESVLKAVQSYTQETSKEIVTETDVTSEYTESGMLTNTNDELACTYLFYELQKRYRLSEQLYRVTPVVLVAQEVPAPNQITEAWVIANDWILNRALLDDSFRPTLSYLANKSVGDDFALRELRKNLRQQRNLVATLQIEFSAASMEADNRYKALETAISNRIDEEHAEATDGFGSDLLDFFGGGGQDPEAAKARELAAKDAQQYALEKAEKANAALRQEVSTLHTLTENYNNTLEARLDNETKVKRFLVHVCNNIFYYMQSIWTMEPPDQRYLRLYKVQVPILELQSRSYTVNVNVEDDIFAPFREPGTEKHKAFLHGTLKHNPDGSFTTKTLVEVADLDNLLGFRGNYMIFPMKEHNALTEFMAAPYIDAAFGAMDPDELSNVNLDEYSKYVCCLHDKLPPDEFEALKPQLKAWLEKLMATPLRNGDEIVVPTGSLFIETLVDPNPILEDFKLKHRELDVFKADEEVRKAGLENIRLAARLLNAEREDPDIEKKVVVSGTGLTPAIAVDDA